MTALSTLSVMAPNAAVDESDSDGSDVGEDVYDWCAFDTAQGLRGGAVTQPLQGPVIESMASPTHEAQGTRPVAVRPVRGTSHTATRPLPAAGTLASDARVVDTTEVLRHVNSRVVRLAPFELICTCVK